MSNTIQIHLRLPIGLVEMIDSRLGTTSRENRQDFIEEAIRQRLRRIKELEQKFKDLELKKERD